MEPTQKEKEENTSKVEAVEVKPEEKAGDEEKTVEAKAEEKDKTKMSNAEKEYEFLSRFSQRSSNHVRTGDQIKDQYKFWDTQPVPKITSDNITEIGPIDDKNDLEAEKKVPYKLPNNFSWYDVNIYDKNDLTKLYEFLRDNYVEDDDNMFRFDYSKEFLFWHLTAPGTIKQWLCGVHYEDKTGNKKLVGFISAIPVHLMIHGVERKMVEINFLCVNSKYRKNRLAPVLIKEITRRVHLQNLWQAVYTAGVLLPKPVSKCTYYHRNINIQKLLDIKFTYLNPKLNISRAKVIYKLSKDLTLDNVREMKESDVNQVHYLLNTYLNQFKIHAIFSKDEIRHWFLPVDKVVYAYVVENPDTTEITDFFSFYSLPSSILQHPTHKTLFAAYSFFNVATKCTYKELIKNALIMAKLKGFDVYNTLNIMENQTILNDLLFGMGDGTLKYYFYNFQCPSTEPKDLSLVLM